MFIQVLAVEAGAPIALLQVPVMLTQGCLQAITALKGAVIGYQLSNPHVKKPLNMYLQDRQICLVYWLNNPCVEKALNMNAQSRGVSLDLLQQWWAFQKAARDHTSVAHEGHNPQIRMHSSDFILINSLTQTANLNKITPSFVLKEKYQQN